MWDHFIGTSELFVWMANDFSNPEAFEVLRPAAADRVRMEMLSNNSANCRRCHVMEAIKPERLRGQKMHNTALKERTTCISCHYNLVHKDVEPSKAFLKAIE
jgi:cytochrome c-type protein NapC